MIAANQSEDKIRKDLKEHYRRRRAPTTEVPPPAQAPAGTGTGTSAAEHARTGTTPPGYPLTVPPSTGSTPVPIPDEQPADAGASAADSQATHTPSTPPGYPTHAPPSTGTTPAPVLIEQSSGARAGAADTQATHTPSTPPGYPADAPPSTGTTPAPLPNQQSTDAGSATADASIQTDRIRDPSPCAGHVTDHRPCKFRLLIFCPIILALALVVLLAPCWYLRTILTCQVGQASTRPKPRSPTNAKQSPTLAQPSLINAPKSMRRARGSPSYATRSPMLVKIGTLQNCDICAGRTKKEDSWPRSSSTIRKHGRPPWARCG